jgi:GTP:adenosylcobinamide-phosphate guanylyltransferase
MLNVATTILQQLGGNRFIAMTGANNLVAEDNALIFRLPENLTKNRIAAVGIYLEPSDTYRMKFIRQKGAPTFAIDVVAELGDIYCEDLQRIFTQITGLDTHL